MNMTVLTSHAKIIFKINALKESVNSMKRLILSMKPTEHLTNSYSFALQISHIASLKSDESCVYNLVKEDQKSKMFEIISQRQPNLRSFMQQSKAIVLSAMTALLSISLFKKLPNQPKFDTILEVRILLDYLFSTKKLEY